MVFSNQLLGNVPHNHINNNSKVKMENSPNGKFMALRKQQQLLYYTAAETYNDFQPQGNEHNGKR